jgi:O-antigen/teichoic acid export membrane protein
MQGSYSKNYLKIYFYQILSIVLGFVSLFIVVPYLSANQTTYGIYAICISITVFLSYADLGFLGAGMKYAAESYSRGDRDSEISLVGFSHFVLLIFVLLLSSLFIFLSFNPELLIKGLTSGEHRNIAQNLLLILAVFSPTIVLQRALQMIFSIRLHDFILQRVNIVGNILKIASVFYFFRAGQYDIVNYFLCIQIVNLLCAVAGIFIARRRYQYDFILLIKKVKFNSAVFKNTKSLAFSSLFATLSWILYYELDSFAIGKMLGAKDVAVYAIGFTILTFFRSLLGVFFSPFAARFNHFIGEGREKELKQFYLHVITITLPVVVFPILAVVLFARPLVVSWVGNEYADAVNIVRWLVLCNIFAFISYPAGMLLVAKEKIKDMYVINLLMPIIYWVGIILSIGLLGLESFAVFKFAAFLISTVIYLRLSMRFLDISLAELFNKYIFPYVPAILIMSVGLFFFNDLFIGGKSKLYLFYNILIICCGLFIGFSLSLITARPLRDYLIKSLKSIFKS